VVVRGDAEAEDRYGRAWSTSSRAGGCSNAELVREGYATALPIRPNTRHRARLAAEQRGARAGGRACGRLPRGTMI
jgi:endonuclease YncB( thermonuclease family)